MLLQSLQALHKHVLRGCDAVFYTPGGLDLDDRVDLCSGLRAMYCRDMLPQQHGAQQVITAACTSLLADEITATTVL